MNYKNIMTFMTTLGLFISCSAFGKSYRATEITGYMKTPILSEPHRAFDENYAVTPLSELEATVSFPFRPSVKNKKVNITLNSTGPNQEQDIQEFSVPWELSNTKGEYYETKKEYQVWETLSFFPTQYEEKIQIFVEKKANGHPKTIGFKKFFYPSITTCPSLSTCFMRVKTPEPIIDLTFTELQSAS